MMDCMAEEPRCPGCKGRLECVDANYSGTGTDIATCKKCGKGFSISYQINKITRAKDWDRDFEEEKKFALENAEARVRKAKKELAELEAELKSHLLYVK